MSIIFRRPQGFADLIPLVPRMGWELYHLFESFGEEPHALGDGELAERCGVDHDVSRPAGRFVAEELCPSQRACTAAYYAWLDERVPRPAPPERLARSLG